MNIEDHKILHIEYQMYSPRKGFVHSVLIDIHQQMLQSQEQWHYWHSDNVLSQGKVTFSFTNQFVNIGCHFDFIFEHSLLVESTEGKYLHKLMTGPRWGCSGWRQEILNIRIRNFSEAKKYFLTIWFVCSNNLTLGCQTRDSASS